MKDRFTLVIVRQRASPPRSRAAARPVCVYVKKNSSPPKNWKIVLAGEQREYGTANLNAHSGDRAKMQLFPSDCLLAFVQSMHILFPFSGEILNCLACCH